MHTQKTESQTHWETAETVLFALSPLSKCTINGQ